MTATPKQHIVFQLMVAAVVILALLLWRSAHAGWTDCRIIPHGRVCTSTSNGLRWTICVAGYEPRPIQERCAFHWTLPIP